MFSQAGDTVTFRDINVICYSENVLEFSYLADMSDGKAEFRHVPKEHNSYLIKRNRREDENKL